MTPKFNTWYIIWHRDQEFSDGSKGDYPEFDIFWKVRNKWMAYSQTHFKKLATFWYDNSDFILENGQRLATKEEIQKYNMDIDQARHETIISLLDPKRWE